MAPRARARNARRSGLGAPKMSFPGEIPLYFRPGRRSVPHPLEHPLKSQANSPPFIWDLCDSSADDATMSLGKVEKAGRRDVVHSEQPFKVPIGNAQHCSLIETIQARLQLRKV